MERVWTFETLCVSESAIDFVDPAIAGQPGSRERGVRLEVRPFTSSLDGSVYASPEHRLGPAVLRVDLLESSPGAADRMHWHPVMSDGEPGERTFDEAIPAGPRKWLTDMLDDLGQALERSGTTLDSAAHRDVRAVAAVADEIAAAAVRDLESTREPWPDVEHDHRGIAVPAAS